MEDKIVCACNRVTVEVVKEFLEKNPEADLEQSLVELNIGTRCKCCLRDECKRIEVSYKELIK